MANLKLAFCKIKFSLIGNVIPDVNQIIIVRLVNTRSLKLLKPKITAVFQPGLVHLEETTSDSALSPVSIL